MNTKNTKMIKKKNVAIFFALLATVVLTKIGYNQLSNSEFEKGRPSEISENETEKTKRKEWENNMHRSAPGTDWRAIEEANRYTNQQLFRSYGKVAQQEILANGHLTGEWREKGCTSNTGRILNADYDASSGMVYCASDGGNIWKGNMNGTGWTVLNDKNRIGTQFLNIIPIPGGKRILTGGGKTIQYSDNDGALWQTAQGLNNVAAWGWFKKTMVLDDAAKTVFLLLEEWDYVNWYSIVSIYKSSDKGQNYSLVKSYPTSVYGDLGKFDLWAPRFGNPILILVQNDSTFSVDPQTNAFTFTGTFPLANAGGELITGYRDNNSFVLYTLVGQDLYRSTNGGYNWSFISGTPVSSYDNYSFSCSLSDPTHLFLSSVECYRSFDNGQNWTLLNNWWDYNANPAINLHADIHAIVPYKDNNNVNRVFVCTDGSIFDSNDDLQSVNNLAVTGLNTGLIYTTYTNRADANYIYVGTQDQGYLQASSDPGGVLSFAQQITGDYGHIVSSDGGNTIWMNYPGFTRYVTNPKVNVNGFDWDFNTNAFNRSLWIPPMMAHPTNNNIAYIAGGNLNGTGSHIVQLQYSGGNINATELAFDFEAASTGGYITAMALSPINSSYRYVLTDNGYFYYSSDAGSNWTQSDSSGLPGTHWFYGATIYPSKTTLGTVYIGGSGYNNPPVYVSANHGKDFTNICSNNGMPSTLVHQLTGSDKDSVIVAATEAGPYAYIPSENKWYNISGLAGPDQNYWSVDYVPLTNTMRFGTHGRGVWDFAITSLVSIIEKSKNEFSVIVFPNPTNDFVAFKFSGNKEAQLLLYNSTGQQVLNQQIVSNEKAEIASLSEGIYLYNIVVNGKSFTGKFLKSER